MVVLVGHEQRNIHSLTAANFIVILLQQSSAGFQHHSSPPPLTTAPLSLLAALLSMAEGVEGEKG